MNRSFSLIVVALSLCVASSLSTGCSAKRSTREPLRITSDGTVHGDLVNATTRSHQGHAIVESDSQRDGHRRHTVGAGVVSGSGGEGTVRDSSRRRKARSARSASLVAMKIGAAQADEESGLPVARNPSAAGAQRGVAPRAVHLVYEEIGESSDVPSLGAVRTKQVSSSTTVEGSMPRASGGFPFADFCVEAIPIDVVPSDTFGTTVPATVDAAPACGTASIPTAPGVWYRVLGTGFTMTASTCNELNTHPDTQVSVFCGGCDVLACANGNDDDDGCRAYTTLLSTTKWCSERGREYLILVHGFGVEVGDFTLTVWDDGVTCTTPPRCDAASACCIQTDCVDGLPVEVCREQGGNWHQGSDCTQVNCCDITCDPASTPENESDCGLPVDTVNGGCNSNPYVWSPISCGESVCGTASLDGGARDTDWYEVTVAASTVLNWQVTAEFAFSTFIVRPSPADPCANFQLIAGQGDGNGAACGTTTISACVGPGTYWLFVAPDANAPPFTCEANLEYEATLRCDRCLTGACCLQGGTCAELGVNTCNAISNGYLGDGVPCDPDCCPQPYGGQADCSAAQVTPVPVDGTTVTVSGDNSNAITDPCLGGEGWWEGLSIDSCADLYIDYCCTSPPADTVYLALFNNCPACDFIVTTDVSGGVDSIQSCADGNLRMLWAGLPAGTYHYPIYSAPDGSLHGPYQMHFTAYPCSRGACCVDGVCLTDFGGTTGREHCEEIGGSWFLDQDCNQGFFCPGALGSCCDDNTGICTDGDDPLNCPPPQRFTAETLCADLIPPCGGPLGACCIAGDCVDAMSEADCVAQAGIWYDGGDCAGITCPLPPLCPDNTIYGQPVHAPWEVWNAYTSDDGIDPVQLVYENFGGVTGPICDLHWWGLEAFYNGEIVEPCKEDPMTFSVTFYENSAVAVGPGQRVCSYQLSPTRTPTGLSYAGYELIEYGVDLPDCCVLEKGWVSIQGIGLPDCWFWWTTSAVGDGASCIEIGGELDCAVALDYSYCLTKSTVPIGACCVDGTCTGVMREADCLEQSGTWFEGEDCATVNCPLPFEACCFTNLTCASLLSGLCSDPCLCKPDMNCDGALDANDVDPFLLAMSDPAAYGAQYPDCELSLADLDCDGDIDEFDLHVFYCMVLEKDPPDCIDMDSQSCVVHGGVPQGPGTSCTTITCPPSGACCVAGTCTGVMQKEDCLQQAGTWFEGDDCSTVECGPIACEQSPFPACDGECPPDMVCVPDSFGGACRCEPIPCEQSAFPACGGDCPPGTVCTTGQVTGECICTPIPCEEGPYPVCDGPCPAGTVCTANTIDGVCTCELAPCEPTIDGKACEDVLCPNDGACLPTCMSYDPATGATVITDCLCRASSDCYIQASTGRGTVNVCEVPDNATGTITLPPEGCEYLSPDEVHEIIDGLPPGTTIELDAIHKDFICRDTPDLCSTPLAPGECEGEGGSLGGHGDCFDSTLELHVSGTGALAGFARTLFVPISCEIHTGPRNPGDPVQSFATDMFRLQGELFGDPDFCTFRVTGGTDNGLPSPGQTTLTQLPSGNFNVDSFFDITYQIEFAGCPGSQLDGLAGTTTATIRMQTGAGSTPPSCVGVCPEGTICEEKISVKADGTLDICCDCVTPPLPPDPHITLFGTSATFGAPDVPAIPADFFSPGSDPFIGQVNLVGGPTDTLGQRDGPIVCTGVGFPRPCDLVGVELVQLDLVSAAPIVVTENGGQNPAAWDVAVDLSPTGSPPLGTILATLAHANGGTYNADIPFSPRFTFTEVGNPGNVRVLDYDSEGFSAIIINFLGVDWVIHLGPVLVGTIEAPNDGNFVPGVREVVPGDSNSQIVIQSLGESKGGGIDHPVQPPQFTQACCFDDGSCIDLILARCLESGGVPQALGSTCDDVDCRPNAVERDYFEDTTALVQFVGGPVGAVPVSYILRGPSEAHVFFEGPNEGDANDSDGNGRDDVATELVQLDLTGSGVTLSLRPGLQSVGQIEELVNNNPGWLDVDPFAPGDADSFFDVFFQIDVGGFVLHNEQPVHIQAIISEKPPIARYFHIVFGPNPVELYDDAGNPTGVFIVRAEHYTGHIEVDYFPASIGELELINPQGLSEVISLTGPTTAMVYFERAEGEARDDNGNGRDEVETELTDMNLTGQSSMGAVTVQLNPSLRSIGGIEERVNDTPGTLDVPPFVPPGALADSFFDVFFEITVGNLVLHTDRPKRLSSVIAHKPPGPGAVYENREDIELLFPDGRPSGYLLGATRHRPRPPIEIDRFPFSVGNMTLMLPDGTTESFSVAGEAEAHVFFEGGVDGSAISNDGDGLDEVQTEMVSLSLAGESPLLGPVVVTLNPNIPSRGEIEEQVNNTPGTLDVQPFTPTGLANSYFDMFFVVTLPNLGVQLHTLDPKRMSSVIAHKPPGPGALYENLQDIRLYDANGEPTEYWLSAAHHRPSPPIEIDEFDLSIGQFNLITPAGSELISVSGPATVHVFFEGGSEGDAQDNDGDGVDEVVTEMVSLNMTGVSSMGPITVRVHPTIPSMGEIEELVNNNPGLLDLDPFAPGDADSFFDIFFEVEVGGQTFHTQDPKRMSSRITEKPPGPGALYESREDIQLYDADGNLTGFFIGATHHRPRPECGTPEAGGCFEPHNTAFCDHAECCERVCAQMPFCCEVEWSDNCAGMAREICGATLVTSRPEHGKSLWRSKHNIARLLFDGDIAPPGPGEVLIQELLPNGQFGPDLSHGFSFTVESDGGSNPRVLRVWEDDSILQHRTWYAVRNVGRWAGVTPFELHYLLQVGDADGNMIVISLDVGAVNAGIPCFVNCGDDNRLDTDGDFRVISLDVGVINGHIGSFTVPKPTGH